MSGAPQAPDTIERRIRAAQRRAVFLATLALAWERLWPRLWPLAAILAGALGVFLTDVLPMLPVWLHGAMLAAAAAALAWSVVHTARGFRPPDAAEVVARIERDSGYRHRPLSVLDDDIDPAASSKEAQALWAAHRARTLAALRDLRVRLPAPNLARHDPVGLRALAFLILVIGVTAGATDPWQRIARALDPGTGSVARAMQVDVWVTPPGYTGQTPFYLSNGVAGQDGAEFQQNDTAAIAEAPALMREIPVGSRVIAQAGVTGDDDGPEGLTLALAGSATAFEQLGAGGFRADTVVETELAEPTAGRLAVRVGDTEATGWPVTIVPDLPPVIDFTQPPSRGSGGQLRVSFHAMDDFGIRRAEMVINNPAFDEDEDGGAPLRVPLPLSRAQTADVETSVIRDMSAHDWAGLPVELQLVAEDAVGAVGRSIVIPMILPERVFNHPIARTLAEFRKQLVKPTEEDIGSVVIGLDSVTRSPQMFSNMLPVFLGIRVARARLVLDRDGDETGAVRDMLWTMALTLEDGEFAIAGRELREAQERVMQALRESGFDEAANQLLDQLQDALDRYLDALHEQLQNEGMENISDLPGMEYFDKEDFRQMIEDARELARTGSTEAAEAALAELAQMLQSLQNAMNAGAAGQEQLNAARQMLEDLTSISREQQDLLDRTFREMRRSQGLQGGLQEQQQPGEGTQTGEGAPGAGGQGGEGEVGSQGELNPTEAARALSGPQEALRRRLKELGFGFGQMMGEVPRSLGEADRALGSAVQSLSEGSPATAVPSQTDALDQIRRTTEGFIERLTQQMRGMPGAPGSAQGQLPSDGSDPFGRLGGGVLGQQMDDGTVKVPDRGDIVRSRRIYDELRRRAGQRYRPRFELNYIERLLTPF